MACPIFVGLVLACSRMSVGYPEVLPFRGQALAYRTTLLGNGDHNPRAILIARVAQLFTVYRKGCLQAKFTLFVGF